jgi:hypothetical protein
VVATNAILFPDERATSQWMGGFYVANIEYRLFHLHHEFGDIVCCAELDTFMVTWYPFTNTNPINKSDFFRHAINAMREIINKLTQLTAPIEESGGSI